MYITLYYIVTRLPDSLRVVRDHFLSICPTTLTIDLLEKTLLAIEKSIFAVGASRGDPRTPVFEGCSPSPLLPSVASAAAADLVGFEALEGQEGAVEVVLEAVEGVRVVVGVVPGVVAAAAAVEAAEAVEVAEGAEAAEVVEEAEVEEAAEAAAAAEAAVVERVVTLRRGVAPVVAGVAIFGLDFDAILAAMYAVADSVEGACYLCVPPEPGIEAATLGADEAAALGASASAAPGAGASAAPGAGDSAPSGTTSAQAFHTFTLDSGASRSFFRDRTTLTPLSQPVAVSLADPSGGPVLASFSTVLPCPAAPSGTLSSLYLPLFSTNLVAASSQVFAAASWSGPESAPCSCHLLSHHTLLWHHRLGHPSLPRLRGMASCVVVCGLPRSLPPLPSRPNPTCVPCVEGRQHGAPHSYEFPPTKAPLQTLHMDVWGPAHVRGQGRERYFLLVVDDYSRYTTVFPLCGKGDVTETFTLPASPQQNWIAERRIGMVMDFARTSMMHAAAPHFLWLFAVQYAAHQLNLQPWFSLPETSPALRCTRKLGDASAFWVWGSRAFVRDLSADKLSPRADVTFDESVPYYCLFPYRTAPLPPPPLFLAPGATQLDPLLPQGPATSRVSQVDAVEPVEVAVDSGAARGAEPAGAGSGGAESGGAETWGGKSGGAETWGAEPGGAAPGGAERGGAELGGAGFARVADGDALSRREPLSLQEVREWFAHRWRRAAESGGAAGVTGVGPPGAAVGAGAAGGGAAAGFGAGVSTAAGASRGIAEAAGADGPTGVGSTGAAVARSVGACGAAGAGASEGAGVGAVGAGGAAGAGAAAGGTGAVLADSGGAARPRPYFIPLLEQVLESSLPSLADPVSDSLRAASPTITRLLATIVTDPSFESTTASALVAELVDFAATCRRDYATSLIAESEFVCPPSVGDAPDIPTPRSYAEAIKGPYSSQWQSAIDAQMASLKSIGTYVDEQVYGLCEAPRQWHDTLRTTLAALGFAPSTADPSLFLRTDTSLPPFYILVYVKDLVFAAADTA
ncbi:unnamed protein product [Closterium sp. NIES-65]|nr:unnamed protein product [Closterium sp. NIES-65]